MRVGLVNALLLAGISLTVVAAYECRTLSNPLRLIALTVCWFAMIYFPHCLAHYIVGRFLGVEFSHYTISKSMLSKVGIPIISKLFSARIFLTLRIKKRAGKRAMFAMFLAGPLASMLCPLVVVYIAYSYDRVSATLLAILTIFNILFAGYFSCKHGCIRKALNSLR
ncbi:hypothetical protein [Archaeoglobus profundus]|uniref:Uncharacterized protein n=1 Tax=Archaeoglobus profundus (strain DSM 5631 / JCM 9629 / NBRC 100127 / Av18) TaxID=572546 RepID=D2RFM7_ARCPA|nr:hypothetical protein [Archaeoglobus profundus]ADB57102.1 hypothetical protein Arcpr_0024 [Archaeoglobus profundus DSM 5631]